MLYNIGVNSPLGFVVSGFLPNKSVLLQRNFVLNSDSVLLGHLYKEGEFSVLLGHLYKQGEFSEHQAYQSGHLQGRSIPKYGN